MSRKIILIVLALLVFFTGCAPRPGEGPLADEGRATAAPVIAALEKFKTEKGAYPKHLDELVPGYIESNPQRRPEGKDGKITYNYYPNAKNDSYALKFTYTTSIWTDDCRYESKIKEWRCGGKM